MIENGLGLQAENLQPSNIEMIGKALYASVIEYWCVLKLPLWCERLIYLSVGIGLVKLSMLIMYRRVFDTRIIRILVNNVGNANATWVLLLIALTVFQCIPVQRAWNPNIPGECLDTKALFIGNAIPHIVIDLIMVAMPIHPVSKLELPLSQRIALIGIFMLGGIVCIVSMYRVTTLAAIDATNLAFTLRGPAVLGNVEMATSVISASLPTLRPLYSAFMCVIGLSKGNGVHRSNPKGEGRSRSSTLTSLQSRVQNNEGFTVIGMDDGPRLASKPLPQLPATSKKTDDRVPIIPLDAMYVRYDVDIETAEPARSDRIPRN